jgi:hypothetical protein
MGQVLQMFIVTSIDVGTTTQGFGAVVGGTEKFSVLGRPGVSNIRYISQ